ncbi:hypothetical protein SRABI118_00191 [Massilia sp. Bi118]|nr:hypothetical protein SRABI118_00191 [Massilia sp. Bi118]
MTHTASPTQRMGWAFPACLLLVLAVLFALTPPYYGGDVAEYTAETVALATHASPDIRLADVDRTLQLAPYLGGPLGLLRQGMAAGDEKLYAAFMRGRDRKVYSIHALGYPALSVPPFKLLEGLGLPPFKAFQVVNYAAVFILGLALWRFFRSGPKAMFGVALFLGCAGILYLDWTSPECLSAACLLAGLLLFLCDAPIAAGLLGGVAGLQNPTLVFFFVFAPLLKLQLDYRAGLGLAANLRARLPRRAVAGLLLGAALYALPTLFSLATFGVPNVIAKYFTLPELVNATRLLSFFFDLNQGMILGIPGVAAALALWGWRSGPSLRRNGATLALCLLFTLALMLPSLAVPNWNSGAAGVMRYAFWASMPILLALLLRLKAQARWPAALVAGLVLAQAGAMWHASTYAYTRFSPLAKMALAWAPYQYHPEPEIFAERAGNNDDYIWPDKVYTYKEPGQVQKILFCPADARSDALLCGEGAVPGPDNHVVESTHGWRYIDGPVRCRPAAGQQNIHKEIFAIGQLCQIRLP